MVKWSLMDSTGCKQRGEIEMAQIPGELLRLEREAARVMKKTGSRSCALWDKNLWHR